MALYKLICVGFEDPSGKFARLIPAFKRSVAANAPAAELEFIEPTRPEAPRHYNQQWTDNHLKLHLWRDTLVLRDLWDAFTFHEFDVAITRRPEHNPYKKGHQPRSWLNGGVVFVRQTPLGRLERPPLLRQAAAAQSPQGAYGPESDGSGAHAAG